MTARARLDALIGAGVTYFIDLTQPGELPPYDHLLPPARERDGRYVIYVRKAIRDHGLPQQERVMEDILDYIARALEVGHLVYLHCRAGIGRTNTVAGCWLRRGGMPGPAALERLNRLWRASARARSWPRIPETEEQLRYILDWREPDPDPDAPLTLRTARALRDRYLGCVLGLACGDAIGATLQFRKPGEFAPVADMLGGGHWQLPRGAWTDDTAMSLCLADSLLEQEDFDAPDQWRRYRRWQEEGYLSSTGQCIGITSVVASARARPVATAQSALAAHAPAGAQALVRIGAVALFAASAPERVFAWAAATVELTDRAAALRAASQCYASLLLAALRGSSRQSLAADARELLRAGAAPAAACERLLEDDGAPPDPGTGDANAVLKWVVGVLVCTSGFRDGLLRIVNQGGDADVHGAIFGQLAGALYGAQGIPRSWRKTLLGRELLQEFADRLLAAALAPRA